MVSEEMHKLSDDAIRAAMKAAKAWPVNVWKACSSNWYWIYKPAGFDIGKVPTCADGG